MVVGGHRLEEVRVGAGTGGHGPLDSPLDNTANGQLHTRARIYLNTSGQLDESSQ